MLDDLERRIRGLVDEPAPEGRGHDDRRSQRARDASSGGQQHGSRIPRSDACQLAKAKYTAESLQLPPISSVEIVHES
jgi:hypothetical protein